jgi:hypothetical protein
MAFLQKGAGYNLTPANTTERRALQKGLGKFLWPCSLHCLLPTVILRLDMMEVLHLFPFILAS